MPAVTAPLADAADSYLRRRRSLLVRLARVERALRRRDAWETDARLPADLERPVTEPVLTREALDGPRRMLTEESARPDGPRPAAPEPGGRGPAGPGPPTGGGCAVRTEG
jgi:hypothetical protein